jgi:hypothetical protein
MRWPGTKAGACGWAVNGEIMNGGHENAAIRRSELPVAGQFSNLSHGRAKSFYFAPIPQTSESIAKNTGFSGV